MAAYFTKELNVPPNQTPREVVQYLKSLNGQKIPREQRSYAQTTKSYHSMNESKITMVNLDDQFQSMMKHLMDDQYQFIGIGREHITFGGGGLATKHRAFLVDALCPDTSGFKLVKIGRRNI